MLPIRFVEAREYLALSVSEVSIMTGLSEETIQQVENGRNSPSNEVLRKLSLAYRRPQTFFTDVNASKPAIPPALARLTVASNISENDKVQIAKFAEYLAGI